MCDQRQNVTKLQIQLLNDLAFISFSAGGQIRILKARGTSHVFSVVTVFDVVESDMVFIQRFKYHGD